MMDLNNKLYVKLVLEKIYFKPKSVPVKHFILPPMLVPCVT